MCNTASRFEELIVALTKILETAWKSGKTRSLAFTRQISVRMWTTFWPCGKDGPGSCYQPRVWGNSSPLNNKAILALTFHRHLLACGKPRVLRVSCDDSRYIQTDAMNLVRVESFQGLVQCSSTLRDRKFRSSHNDLEMKCSRGSTSTLLVRRRPFMSPSSLHFSAPSSPGCLAFPTQ